MGPRRKKNIYENAVQSSGVVRWLQSLRRIVLLTWSSPTEEPQRRLDNASQRTSSRLHSASAAKPSLPVHIHILSDGFIHQQPNFYIGTKR